MVSRDRYTLSGLHECRVVPGKDNLGNVIFGVTDPVWIVYAGIIPFYYTLPLILFYWIPSGCGHELYSAEGVLGFTCSASGR